MMTDSIALQLTDRRIVPGGRTRAGLHYVSAFIFMAMYGGQVCPFIDSLSPGQLLPPLIMVMGFQWLLRNALYLRYVRSQPDSRQVIGVFQVESALFLVPAILLMVYNATLYNFPVGSGLKIVLGYGVLGFFSAIDLALDWERRLVVRMGQAGHQIDPRENYFPLTRKLTLVATACAVFTMAVGFLVINKDLEWLVGLGDSVSLAEAQQSILLEICFVALVFLVHILNVIQSFSVNLRLFFVQENDALEQATQGRFERRVPVGSNDEFGVMAVHTNAMIQGLRDMVRELNVTRDVTIRSLASLAETRDNETGAHILRTQRYVRTLAEALRHYPRFQGLLDDATIELLFKSAPLHDIGKVGIPDAILLKPGKLTAEEFETMKQHARLGYEALRTAEEQLGQGSFMRVAREIAYTHHEKWDGSGYPRGLRGDEIPLSGRLMALADVYDALITRRVYKPAFSHEKARAIILEGRATHFDPDIVDAFIAEEQAFIRIAQEFNDHDYQAGGSA